MTNATRIGIRNQIEAKTCCFCAVSARLRDTLALTRSLGGRLVAVARKFIKNQEEPAPADLRPIP